MMAEYAMYHGLVFFHLVAERRLGGVSLKALPQGRRNDFYVLNGRVGMLIKHSTARLRPWQFGFDAEFFSNLSDDGAELEAMFLVLVCRLDGLVVLTLDEVRRLTAGSDAARAWLRVNRGRREQYSVSGNAGALPYKRASGLELLVECIV